MLFNRGINTVKITALSNNNGINCRFNGLTWNYFFRGRRNVSTIPPTRQLLTAYVILSIMRKLSLLATR
jgi:hypothetical protein